MRPVRILLFVVVTVFVVALAAFAIVGGPQLVAPADDDIIIKGGSLEVECGKNHKTDNAGCLALDDGLNGRFKHKQSGKHITRVVVKNTSGTTVFNSDSLNSNLALGQRPRIELTYK